MSKQGGWPSTGFGSRLRALRERAGLTQPGLAEKAGCNKFTVAKLERGTQEPAWPLVLALAKALGVECTAFIAEETLASAAQVVTQESASDAGQRPRGRPAKVGGKTDLEVGETDAADKAKGKGKKK